MSQGQRNVLFGVIAVVAFIGAGYSFFRGGRGVPEISERFTAYGVCLACKWEGRVDYPRGELAPHACEQCGEQAVYPLFYCYNCQMRFVPRLGRSNPSGPPRIPLVATCSHCGSSDVTPYMPEAQTEEPVGDVRLPRWPQ